MVPLSGPASPRRPREDIPIRMDTQISIPADTETAVAVNVGPAMLPERIVGAVCKGVALTCEAFVFAAIAFTVLLTFINTVMRYIASDTILWFEEATLISLNVITFLGAAVAFSRGDVMAFTFVQERASDRVRAILGAASNWLVILVCVALLREFPAFLADARNRDLEFIDLTERSMAIWMGVGLGAVGLFAVNRLLKLGLSASLAGLVPSAAVFTLLLAWREDALGLFAGIDPLIAIIAVAAYGIAIGASIPYVLTLGGLTYFFVTASPAIAGAPGALQAAISNFILLAIPFFVVAGDLMATTGMSRRLIELVDAWIGRWRGGLLLSEIGGVYIFSGISGASTADMAAVGGALKEPLRERGYPEGESVAVLAASGAMGVTVPPSIPLIIIGSLTTVSVGTLFVAGLLPALVLAIALVVAVFVRAKRLALPMGTPFDLGTAFRRIPGAIPALVVPVLVVGGIVAGVATPTEAASIAVVYGVLAASLFYRGVPFSSYVRILRESAATTGLILFLLSGANVFSQGIVRAGLPDKLLELMTQVGGQVTFLLIIALGLVAIGSFLEGLPALYIFTPLLFPIAVELGIEPLQFAIVCVIAVTLGAFIPPFGVGLYIACQIMGTPVNKAVRPTYVYLSVLLVGLLCIVLFPWITTLVPTLFGLE